MASAQKRNENRKHIARMSSDYGARAAAALNELLPGRHGDKTLARVFGCSLRLAQYLRRGQCWTADRLTQASREFGVAFDALLISPEALNDRLDRMDAEIANLRKQIGTKGDE